MLGPDRVDRSPHERFVERRQVLGPLEHEIGAYSNELDLDPVLPGNLLRMRADPLTHQLRPLCEVEDPDVVRGQVSRHRPGMGKRIGGRPAAIGSFSQCASI